MKANKVRKLSGRTPNTGNRRESKNMHSKTACLLAAFAVLIFALFLSANFGNIANAAEGTDDVEYKYYTTITVEKGDTLWDLAIEYYSEKYYDSVSDYVDEVKTINGLKSDTIHEGAKLVIVYFSQEYK
ncbi:MAG: LysM peptidoglycan-binding domain-containing protein [Lachnospiraceae bacterium]|nr:LysM peptidoglycan-binding domain-containing protein [Lachnospiraceae bacterium]